MALFGYGGAGNDAERALRAALSIQRALAELNRRNEDASKPALGRLGSLSTPPAVLENVRATATLFTTHRRVATNLLTSRFHRHIARVMADVDPIKQHRVPLPAGSVASTAPAAASNPQAQAEAHAAVAARAFAADADYDVARKAYLALPRYIFPLAGGAWIRLYSFSNMPVLNAQLQSILSLADYAQLNQDPGAAQLSERLLQTADMLFDDFDTGAWSLYSLGGTESPLNYHIFDTNLLKRIATQTQSPVWTARASRFDRYLTAPPGLSAAGPKKPVKTEAQISIWVSKISRVNVTIGGSTSSMTFSRGSHTFYWSARGRAAGRYSVRVSATDLAGNKASMAFPLIVRK